MLDRDGGCGFGLRFDGVLFPLTEQPVEHNSAVCGQYTAADRCAEAHMKERMQTCY